MDKLTVDANIGARLAGLEHTVELCDVAGKVLGWFRPAEDSEYYIPPFTEEELQTAEGEEGGRSLEEILADLKGRK